MVRFFCLNRVLRTLQSVCELHARGLMSQDSPTKSFPQNKLRITFLPCKCKKVFVVPRGSVQSMRKCDHEVMNLNNIRQAENAKHPHAIIQCLWSMNEFLIMNRVFYSFWLSRLFVKFLFYSWCLCELFRGQLSVRTEMLSILLFLLLLVLQAIDGDENYGKRGTRLL